MSTTFLPLRLQMQQFNSKIIFAHMCCERKRKRREEEEDKISNPGMHFFLSHCSTVLVAWLISAHGRRSFFINCQSFSVFFIFCQEGSIWHYLFLGTKCWWVRTPCRFIPFSDRHFLFIKLSLQVSKQAEPLGKTFVTDKVGGKFVIFRFFSVCTIIQIVIDL